MPCEHQSPETLEKGNMNGIRLGHNIPSHKAGKEQGSQAHNSRGTTGLYRDEDIYTHSNVQTNVKSIKGYGKKVTELQQQHGNYSCVLMNHKNHSHEEETRAQKQVRPKPGPQLAKELTTYKDGFTFSSNIKARTSTTSRSVHKSKVLPSYIKAHQTLVTRRQEGPPSLFRVSSGYRAISSQALFKNRPDTNAKIRVDLYPKQTQNALKKAVIQARTEAHKGITPPGEKEDPNVQPGTTRSAGTTTAPLKAPPGGEGQDQDGIGAGPGTRARDRAREGAGPGTMAKEVAGSGTRRDTRTRTGSATGQPQTIRSQLIVTDVNYSG